MEEVLEEGLFKTQEKGTFYDLLPKGAQIDLGSLQVGTYGFWDTSKTNTSAVNYEVEFIEDWRGSGQTMMIVTMDGRTDGKPNYVYSKSFGPISIQSGFEMKYVVYYSWEDIAVHGTEMLNSAAYHSDEGYELKSGRKDDGIGLTDKSLFEDLDAENPNNRNEKRFMYAESLTTLNPVTAQESGLLKKVMGSDASGSYGNSAQVAYDDSYTYRLRFISKTGQSSSGVIIYDVLEAASTAGESDWRGILEDINISHPQSKSIDVKIYYSTYPNGVDPTVPAQADLSNQDYWTLTKPNELHTVTAIAFNLSTKTDGTPYVFAAGEGVEVFLKMKAPADGHVSGTARNTAYLKATTTPVNGSPSTTTEPSNTAEVHLPEPLTGNLTISKTVGGNAGSTEKAFEFTVTLSNASGQPLTGSYSYTGSSTGSITSGGKISLKHGESVTIAGLPVGTKYKVTEADYSAEDYTSTSVNSAGQIEDSQTAVAAFTNTKTQTPVGPGGNTDTDPDPSENVPDENVPTGSIDFPDDDIPDAGIDLPKTGDTGTASWLWLMVLSAVGLYFTMYMERKRRSGQEN